MRASVARLLGQRAGRGAGFLDERSVLLGDVIDLADGVAHLSDAGRLLLGFSRDLAHDGVDAADAAHHVLNGAARVRYAA